MPGKFLFVPPLSQGPCALTTLPGLLEAAQLVQRTV